MASQAGAATFRYAESSNRIYVEGGGTATLSQIHAALPGAPLQLVSSTGKTWLLRANLIVDDGSVLLLRGDAGGGDVNELRLQSNSSSSGGFVFISAEHGTLDIHSTRIRSWNTSANAVDTNTSDGRAWIRVRSMLASDGVTAQESRMDIVDSEISHLGYNASESYGLTWKVIGSGSGLYDKVQVRGDIFNSDIHHNYFGVYTYGHQDGQWVGNRVHDNVQYGFDPHDDSDDLLIEDNDVFDNGNHGIIASKRCDHVVIRNNRSFGNAGNGIMLHRSSDDAVVEGNESYLNGDSGVALFASSRIVVRNNQLLDNGNAGIRLSVGGADNRVEGNTIQNSGKYGIYSFKGSDAPEPGDDGRIKRTAFVDNIVRDSASDGVKLQDADDTHFETNTFSGDTTFRITNSRNTVMAGNGIPSTMLAKLSGSSSVPTHLTVSEQSTLKLEFVTDQATARFEDSNRQIFDPDEAIFTQVASSGPSVLNLTRSATGGTTTVRARSLLATPASGTARINPRSWGGATGTKSWAVISSSASAAISYVVGSVTPGASYKVTRGSTTVGTFVADSGGRLRFSSAPGTTSEVVYTVAPA